MSVKELQDILAKADPASEVAIDFASFMESDNGTILTIESAEERNVQGADDSGPVGPKFKFLVLSGGMEWHEHGEEIP